MQTNPQITEKLRSRIKPADVVKGKVSVLIPLYGEFDRQRVEISLASILRQQQIDLEVVLAEQSDTSVDKLSERDRRITYVHVPNENLVEGKYYVPGLVRNTAAKASTGEFVYNNDSDVVFQDPLFLRKSIDLLTTDSSIVLYRPPMRRLPKENFEEFRAIAKEKGLEEALSLIDRSQPYVATTFLNPIKMKVFRKDESGREKVFLYTESDHKKYREDPRNQGKEPMYSTLDTHAGGILMRRIHFDIVGGYSCFYAGWGCHDADMQWKLKETFDGRQFPKSPEFEVLHLDHERGYFSQERWLKNREIQSRRKQLGILKAIEEDLNESN